ncbi:zinc finger HIT domain-containing protein 2-like [Chenopodium quinoa]|uniref:HIT-type domain-containing protein n=1 Tax=Chenopodium quinoa TaxID=63459 RepID=A0A803LWP6_CHEQI|nr:zinc finger HIT domain-containing protein 2-like [Chenopodium quinoa]
MEESIALSETLQVNSASSRVICRVCQKQFSQYTCPRCNTRYCSLHCYKSHSLRCTESFMRENVVDEMKQLRPDDESKKKMLEILKRFHAEDEEDGMDEDDSTLSEETIQKALSGGEINYDDLSAEEKKLFQRAITTGELSKMIEPWEPWWLKPSARTISLSHGGTRLIQPLASEEASGSHSVENLESEIPPGPETPLPSPKNLTSAEPSPLLPFHLVDILYSYCFTLRLYNGDWSSDSIGASMVVLNVSAVLSQGAQPESLLEAVSYCLEQTCSPDFRHMGGLQFGFGVLDDVVSLISLGRAAVVCALCDLQRMIAAGEMELKSEKPRKAKSSEVTSKLKSAGRKIYFILCWVNEQPEEVWSSLSVLVQAEKASQLEYQGNGKRRTLKTEKTNDDSKALIKEI